MEREWKNRPSVLVGERVVWVGGSPGLPLPRPHRGTVAWMGRLQDTPTQWTLGIMFESEVSGGCDGSRDGRAMFSCPEGRGLFLQQDAVIRESDFDAIDRSRPAKSPPSRSSPSDSPTGKGGDKERILQVLSGGALSSPSQTEASTNPFYSTTDAPPSSSTTTVISSTSNTSKAELHTHRAVHTVPQQHPAEHTTSGHHHGRRELKEGYRDPPEGARDGAEGSRDNAQREGYRETVDERGSREQVTNDSLVYFGETMVRKSTLPGSVVERASVSTPSSPTLSQYQRQYGQKLSSSSVSTVESTKYMSSPGHYSLGDCSIQPPRKEKGTSGILNIFRWFRNRDKKKRSTSMEHVSNEGSMISLSSAASSVAHLPIMRSKSADAQGKMKSPAPKAQFGLTRRYKFFSRESSFARVSSSTSTSNDDNGRRLSAISASSEASSKPGSHMGSLSRKKRPAPQPPASPKLGETSSIKSEKSCTSLPAKGPTTSPITPDSPSLPTGHTPHGRKLQKSKSESLIYARVKRRAPQPPGQNTSEQTKTSSFTRDGKGKRPAPIAPSADRPISTVSTVSSLSQSLSSASTTLRSQSSSVASSSGPSPDSVMRLESGYLRQDLAKSSSSPSIPETGKLTLSPRPWYKRKKSKNKDTKDAKETEKKEKVYDSWMPDIQYSRSKRSLGASLRRSKSYDTDDDNTLKKTKDNEKEKRRSQVSLLANISELDRAASEQMQREMEQKRAKKENYDSKFYKTNEPHFLTQTDFLPKSESSDDNTLSSSGTGTLGSRDGRRTDNQDINVYDNLILGTQDSTLPQSYSKQATLRIDERDRDSRDSITDELGGQEGALDSSPGLNSPRSRRNPNDRSTPPGGNTDRVTGDPVGASSRGSPIHRAAIDAELFYQLAKDAHAEPRARISPVLSALREGRRLPSYEETSEEEYQEEEEESAQVRESPSQVRKPNKNFGLRMNNFFSPDVSTIIEASESLTSSATTPADDIYDDLPTSSMMNGRTRAESYQDEIISEMNCEFRLNSTNAREIMQELADVRHEIERINEQEEEESRDRERRKAERIRDEILQLRERNNFELWQNAVRQPANDVNSEIIPPAPIDINEGGERKYKWICETCTLINLPWRLQCEACMVRRPNNPKRVDEDGKSVTSDPLSPQGSGSAESPVTVIHEDGSRDAPGAEALQEARADDPENDHTTDKKKKDINWERELQKYFRTFDEHVKVGGSSSGESCSRKSKSIRRSQSEGNSEVEGIYGKIKRKFQGESSGQRAGESGNKGAKPKSKFFGTAAGPPDTFIGSQDRGGQSQDTLEFTIHETHTSHGLNKEPTVDDIRRARLARFQGEGHFEREITEQTEDCPSEGKKGRRKGGSKKGRVSGFWSKKSQSENQTSNISEGNDQELREVNGEETEEERNFYNKNYRKPQVMKPSGAVRNVVSIFNQFEQLHHANKEKPKSSRRKSSVNILERTQAIEQQLNPVPISPELPRSQITVREMPKPQTRGDSAREKEVLSAIAKFDEMAAMAELEKIDKHRQKSKAVRKRPKIFKGSIITPFQAAVNQIGAVNISSREAHVSHFNHNNNIKDSQASPSFLNPNRNMQNEERLETVEVMYTETRQRSLSIGSATFELIQAKDFENIEAQHSEASVYLETRNANHSEHSSQIISASSHHTQSSLINTDNRSESTPTNQIDNTDNDSELSFKSQDVGAVALPIVPQIVIERPPNANGGPERDRKEVERLSQLLTDTEGIASFKATLEVEEPTLGQTNTLNISRLLRRLESAISRGRHAEAASLARELADFRVSCSVTRNPKVPQPDLGHNSEDPGSTTYLSHEARSQDELSDLHQPPLSSNVSECFYDAEEMLEDDAEEELSYSEHDQLLQLGLLENNIATGQEPRGHFKDKGRAEQESQLPENGAPQTSASTKATTSVKGTPQVQENKTKSKNIVSSESRASSNGGKNVTGSSESKNIGERTGDSKVTKDTSEGINSVPDSSLSPPAIRRDTKIDPARREVKSDTISRLLDTAAPDQGKDNAASQQPFNVKMYVEDKKSHQGPLTFSVTPDLTVGDLRDKVYRDFGFPPEVQRWILGRRLADDDALTLEQHKVTSEGCPIFLYLVAPETQKNRGKSGRDSRSNGNPNGDIVTDGRVDRSTKDMNGTVRCLEVYDSEGNVQYKYYNPETRRYEVSNDTDESDDEDDDNEYEDDNSGDDDYEEDEDTLEEDDDDDEDNEDNGNNNLYQNVDRSRESQRENSNPPHTASANTNGIMEQNKNIWNDLLSSESQEGSRYQLPKPLTSPHTPVSSHSNNNVGPREPVVTNILPHHERAERPVNGERESPMTSVSTKHNIKEQMSNQRTQPQQQQAKPNQLQSKPLPIEVPTDPKQSQSRQVQPPQTKGPQEPQPQPKSLQQSQHNQQLAQKSQLESKGPQPYQKSKQIQPSQPQQLFLPVQQSNQQPKQPNKQIQQNRQQQQPQLQNEPLQQKSKPQPSQQQKQPQPKDQSKYPQQQQQSQQKYQFQRSQPQSSTPSTSQQPPVQQSQQKYQKQDQPRRPQPQSSLPSASQSQTQPSQQKFQSPQHKSVPTASIPSPRSSENGWVCPTCTLVNKWGRPGCEACATERPTATNDAAADQNLEKSGSLGAVVSALERTGCVASQESFECLVCFTDVPAREGVVLRDCLHTFCRDCLSSAIKYSDSAAVMCPYRDAQYSCDSTLQDREVRALVTEDGYERHLKKSVKQAEGAMTNVFHCKTPDCPGFCQYEDNVNTFLCSVCQRVNCLTCQEQHEGKSCQEYQDDLKSKVDEAAMKTKKFFDDMIRRGDGLPCPSCSVMLVRKWGCDWMRCPMCRTEICWVTRGPRWGPGGPGDVSGGCKCGIRGQKCHPKCTYCH